MLVEFVNLFYKDVEEQQEMCMNRMLMQLCVISKSSVRIDVFIMNSITVDSSE